jgi:hypothetical protein
MKRGNRTSCDYCGANYSEDNVDFPEIGRCSTCIWRQPEDFPETTKIFSTMQVKHIGLEIDWDNLALYTFETLKGLRALQEVLCALVPAAELDFKNAVLRDKEKLILKNVSESIKEN